jgi:uncharacterized protein (TIGR00255 family)
MTAFGRGSAPYGDGYWQVELKCVNSKFLDYQLRLPARLAVLEERVKKYVGSRLSRGRISIFVTLNGAAAAGQTLSLNLPLLEEYKKIAARLQAELGTSFAKPDLGYLLNNRDLVISSEKEEDEDDIWNSLYPALEQALGEACSMRAAEGAYLAEDISRRLELLADFIDQLERLTPLIIEHYRQRLGERIARLLQDQPAPDLEQRLAQEVAIVTDKCDISEELVRVRSHLAQFRAFLKAAQPVGRKLDFLLQELNREANTIGSKSPDAQAINLVVSLKAELERVREQAQNIE